jgi:hypothetical protein
LEFIQKNVNEKHFANLKIFFREDVIDRFEDVQNTLTDGEIYVSNGSNEELLQCQHNDNIKVIKISYQ